MAALQSSLILVPGSLRVASADGFSPVCVDHVVLFRPESPNVCHT